MDIKFCFLCWVSEKIYVLLHFPELMSQWNLSIELFFLYRVSQKHGVSVSFSFLGDKRNMAIKLVFCTGCLITWVRAMLDSHELSERNFCTGCPKNTGFPLFLKMRYKYTCKRNLFCTGCFNKHWHFFIVIILTVDI